MLNFLLNDDLLGLVQFEISKSYPALTCISTRLRSKRSHLVRIFLENNIMAL